MDLPWFTTLIQRSNLLSHNHPVMGKSVIWWDVDAPAGQQHHAYCRYQDEGRNKCRQQALNSAPLPALLGFRVMLSLAIETVETMKTVQTLETTEPHQTYRNHRNHRAIIESTLYTPHLTLYAPLSSKLYLARSTINTQHFTLMAAYTSNSTLFTPHSTLHENDTLWIRALPNKRDKE